MLVALLLALFVFGAAACGGGEDGGGDEQATAERDSNGPGLRGDTLVVELGDFYIEIPDTLPAGELHVVARNRGVEDHNLEIIRDSELLWEFDQVIGPGRTQQAVLDLEPGEYRVVCTVSGHDGRGMTTRVTVVEGPET